MQIQYVISKLTLAIQTLSQIKFQLIKNETMAKEYANYRWWVPISYASKTYNTDFQRTQPAFWLKNSEKSATKSVTVDKTDWLILNTQETGFYRVNYDNKNWQLIIDQLKSNASEIHIVNRAQLMDDALNLARASLLPYELAFNVTYYLKDEVEYLP
jgi:aminopeptidase N